MIEETKVTKKIKKVKEALRGSSRELAKIEKDLMLQMQKLGCRQISAHFE